MHRFSSLVLCVLLVASMGCDSKRKFSTKDRAKTTTQRIAVTNFPLYCMASKICSDPGGPVKEVIYIGPPKNSDPHTWMPSSDQIRDLQKVDIVICNGPGAVFANWMDKVTIDENKLCKTTNAIKLTEFVVVKDYQLVHSHGPEGEHSHSWVVPQSWLSPRIARKQANVCFKRLVEVYGQDSKLDNGFAELQKKFDELESVCETLREANQKWVVASSTPEIQYLTRELDWTDRYLQWTEPRNLDQAEKELAAMRARVAKDADAPKGEELFLWSGATMKELSELVDSQWSAATTVDLVDRPLLDSPNPDGYFERMADNLKRIGASLE